MTTLKDLVQIKKHPNPFDNVTYGNFWLEKPQYKTINIHQKAIEDIEQQIKYIKGDPLHKIRTVLLTGEQGCGKSHFLGRLKEKFNSQAFFVYIQPIPDKDYLWRHTLRYTVDSLMQIPQGEDYSQIRLWLKGLPVFQDQGLFTKLLGEKTAFIRQLRNTYPSGIYEPKKFFGVLYELAQDDNYLIACDWLKGEQLDDEDLEALRVKKSIDTEIEAQGILNNFGRIANATKPIVLCFDQIERTKDDIFELNTEFHNQCLPNFLIIISIIQQDWKEIKTKIIQSDLSRITHNVKLENISFQEVEKLWESRLEPLHKLCNPKPKSPIEPLELKKLEEKAPGGKINLRESLNLGGILYKEYQVSEPEPGPFPPPPPPPFIKLWKYEFKKTQERIKNMKQFSEPELLDMLKEIFKAYQVRNINSKFLDGKNSSNSFNYTCPKTGIKQGLVWQESPNGTSFNALIGACQKAFESNQCDSLFLLRNEKAGNPGTKGNKLYHTLFKPCSKDYINLNYTLDDIHYLSTYYKLARDAYSGELVMEFKQLSIQELQKLAVKHQVLANCKLLQRLYIVEPSSIENSAKQETGSNSSNKSNSQGKKDQVSRDTKKVNKTPKNLPSNDEVFQIVKNKSIIAMTAILKKIQQNPKYSDVTIEDIKKIIDEIRTQDKSVTILGTIEDSIISYVPDNNR
jgi:hypothetical protein